MNRSYLGIAMSAALVVLLSACSGGAQNDGESMKGEMNTPSEEKRQPEAEQEPVTLVLYLAGGSLTDEEFAQYFADPVKKKFPHVTMQFVKTGNGTRPADLVTSGSQIDLIYTSQGGWQGLLDLQLPADLREFVRAQGLPLGAFDSSVIDWLSSHGQAGELYGLPFSLNGSALFYNKDLFDKFGVAYPVDRMQWDEVLQLSRRMARTEGGITYKPLFVGSLDQFAGQLSPPYTDRATGRTLLESAPWKKAAEYYKAIHELPGNTAGVVAEFFKEKTTALYAGVTIYTLGQVQQLAASNEPFNWDLVSYPNFPESKGKGMPLDTHALLLSSTSKHKEQAFQVMAYVLEVQNQLHASRKGRISALTSKELQEQFGQDLPYLQGKHLSAIFMNAPSVRQQDDHYGVIAPLIGPASNRLVNGEGDVNTVLRQLNEEAFRAVQEAQAK